MTASSNVSSVLCADNSQHSTYACATCLRCSWHCECARNRQNIMDRSVAPIAHEQAKPAAVENVTCPRCQGRKQTTAHVNYGNGRGAWKEIDCLTCKGVGTITPEHVQRLADGDRMRKDRVARGVTLRDEAAARGLTVVQLSTLERGGEPGDLAHAVMQLAGVNDERK